MPFSMKRRYLCLTQLMRKIFLKPWIIPAYRMIGKICSKRVYPHVAAKGLKGGSSVHGMKPLTRAMAGVPYTEQRPEDEGK